MTTQKKSGSGSNLTPGDRKKGGENSHGNKAKSDHKLTASDRKKGGENSR